MMRKLLWFLLPFVLFISACQKNEYIVPNKTIIVNLSPSRWIPSGGGKYYTASIDMPEITDDFNERGGVLAYLSFGDRTYEQLPQVYDGISYTHRTKPGQLIIELQDADDTGTITPPAQTVTLKIILVESEY